MPRPLLAIDLDKIEHNARTIVRLCREHGITVSGVTKGVCGHPDIARAMLRGGVRSLGDSRLINIARMHRSGIDAPVMLIRLPPLSQVDEVVEATNVSLNSEMAALRGLSTSASARGVVHDVILMVELGDLREGIMPDDLVGVAREAARLPGLRVVGIGTNLACFGGVAPDEHNMQHLVDLAGRVEAALDVRLRWISGINSSGLDLIAAGGMPPRVNHARIGEAILLGRETTHRRAWPGTHQDAFVLNAEVLEVRTKPSVPLGARCEDAFGETRTFAERGDIEHALLNIGREDVDVADIAALDDRVTILGASSGYLVVDATGAGLEVGDELGFSVNYGALLAAMTSEYVQKVPLRGGVPVGAAP